LDFLGRTFPPDPPAWNYVCSLSEIDGNMSNIQWYKALIFPWYI
jgi:hypothetical protein